MHAFKRLSLLHTSFFTLAFFAIAAMGISGCVAGSAKKISRGPGQETTYRGAKSQSTANSRGLIKAAIPPDRVDGTKQQVSAGAAVPGIAQSVTSSAGPREQPDRGKWEDQKVRIAALKLAGSLPTVKKIKICFEIAEDEWWVTLYDDLGKQVDLKQFTWNRDTEELERFLVLKRIHRTRMKSHLKKKEKGRACEILDPAPRS